MANNHSSLDAAFHALADPTRRAVVSRLARGPAPVKELAEPFGMGLPAFMKHLGILERDGLIRTEKVGRVRTCRIEAANLARLIGEQPVLACLDDSLELAGSSFSDDHRLVCGVRHVGR